MPSDRNPPGASATPSTLAHRVAGDPAAPTVALVHGFAQTGECFGPFGEALEATQRVVRVDQPGHGGSLRHRDAGVERAADLLVATVGTAAYVGYSMGARVCLQAALSHPDEVRALVLIGGTAGIDDAADRATRRRQDEERAARLEAVGVDAFLREWLAMDMFAGLPDWARFDAERRRNTVEGLAASLRHAGTGSMAPLWDRLGELRCPVLCLTGERDPRYGELAERLVGTVGGPAWHVVVPGAGHAAHLEHPSFCSASVKEFLDGRRTERGGAGRGGGGPVRG